MLIVVFFTRFHTYWRYFGPIYCIQNIIVNQISPNGGVNICIFLMSDYRLLNRNSSVEYSIGEILHSNVLIVFCLVGSTLFPLANGLPTLIGAS